MSVIDRGLASVHLPEVGRFEGISVVLDQGRLPGLPGNGNDIESARGIQSAAALQPGQSRPGELTLLFPVDCFAGMPATLAAAGFDFHEHNGVLVQGNQIDFAHAAAGLSRENAISLPLQIASRFTFALIAEQTAEPANAKNHESALDTDF
jgi:hypothetical protein